MASIKPYVLKNGIVRYEYFISNGINKGTGKQEKIHKRGFPTRDDADRAAKIVEGQIASNDYFKTNPDKLSITAFMRSWLNGRRNIKAGTKISYSGFIEDYVVPRVGNYRIDKYKPQDHQRFIDDLLSDKNLGRKKTGLKLSHVKVLNTVMKGAFNGAIKQGLIKTNPAKFVEFPRDNEEAKIKYYSLEQSELFLEQSKKEQNALWYPLFLLIFDCGLRKGEALGLQWEDIDFSNGKMSIKRERLLSAEKGDMLVTDDPKTKQGIRTLYLTKRCVSALLTYRNFVIKKFGFLPTDSSGQDFIFVATRGRSVGNPIKGTAVNAGMNRIAKAVNLPHITVHDGRHTFAVRSREAGVPLEDIKDLLGHKDVTTTQIYANVSPVIKERAVNQLENYINSQDLKEKKNM